MPLSNPTSRSEARPQDLADWTEGRALVATGSPFAPMQVGDASIPVAQCNNIYIFPGIGLAVTAVRATRVTDAMMTAAAAAVGDAATMPGTTRTGHCCLTGHSSPASPPSWRALSHGLQ